MQNHMRFFCFTSMIDFPGTGDDFSVGPVEHNPQLSQAVAASAIRLTPIHRVQAGGANSSGTGACLNIALCDGVYFGAL